MWTTYVGLTTRTPPRSAHRPRAARCSPGRSTCSRRAGWPCSPIRRAQSSPSGRPASSAAPSSSTRRERGTGAPSRARTSTAPWRSTAPGVRLGGRPGRPRLRRVGHVARAGLRRRARGPDPDVRRRHAEAGVPPGFTDAIAWLVPASDGASHWDVTFASTTPTRSPRGQRSSAARSSSPPTTRARGRGSLRDPHGAPFDVNAYTPPEPAGG